jgi:tetratricopeptide (TPR) repeat protein
MKQRLSCLFLFGLFIVFVVSARAESETETQIRFFEARIQRDPYDFITPTKLGAAFLDKARETGDITFYSNAEKSLKTALTRNPEHVTAQALLASAFLAQHKLAEAITIAEKAIKISPDDVFSNSVLGDALLERGDVAAAEMCYKKIVTQNPGFFVHSRIANLRYIRGDVSGAIESFGRAIQSAEDDNAPKENLAWGHVQQGEIFFRTGEFSKAKSQYEAALKILPDYFGALEHLAELAAAETNFNSAIALYQKVIQPTPRPEFLHALGDVYAFMGKTAEAKLWHDRALKIYLDSVKRGEIHYYHHLAAFYSDAERDSVEAVKWARKDFEIRKNVFACDALAWALFQNAEFDVAAQMITKALAFGTRDAHIFYHASMIYMRSGKAAEGKKLLRELKEINPRYDSFHVHR